MASISTDPFTTFVRAKGSFSSVTQVHPTIPKGDLTYMVIEQCLLAFPADEVRRLEGGRVKVFADSLSQAYRRVLLGQQVDINSVLPAGSTLQRWAEENNVTRSAPHANDLVYSFPHRFPRLIIYRCVLNANILFSIDDAAHSDEVAKLFYKGIALYRGGKAITWGRLAEEWAQTGGDGKKFEEFEASLPTHGVLSFDFSTKKFAHGLSFERYAFVQIKEAFEKLVDFQLDDALEKEFFALIEEELFRLDIVFFLREGALLADLVHSTHEKALSWLRAAKRMVRIHAMFTLSEESKRTLFRWAMEDRIVYPFDRFTEIEQGDKVEGDFFIEDVNQIAKNTVGRSHFYLFLTLHVCQTDQVAKLKELCEILGEWHEFSPSNFELFFRILGILPHYGLFLERAKALAAFLREKGCVGRAPHFLFLCTINLFPKDFKNVSQVMDRMQVGTPTVPQALDFIDHVGIQKLDVDLVASFLRREKLNVDHPLFEGITIFANWLDPKPTHTLEILMKRGHERVYFRLDFVGEKIGSAFFQLLSDQFLQIMRPDEYRGDLKTRAYAERLDHMRAFLKEFQREYTLAIQTMEPHERTTPPPP